MKSLLKLFFIIPAMLSISGCSNSGDDQRIADEVAKCAAIAQISRGRDGVQVMLQADEAINDILKPYNPPIGSLDKPIYTTSLLLSVWFELNDNKNNKATLEWNFDKPEYVNIIPPASEKLPHETVTFLKYPSYGEEIIVKMEATIKYKSAISYAKYDLRLLNTVKQ